MDMDLLEAIGQMMEEKLDKKLKPITERLDRLQADIDELKEDVSELKEAHEVTVMEQYQVRNWGYAPPENLIHSGTGNGAAFYYAPCQQVGMGLFARRIWQAISSILGSVDRLKIELI